jgi:predicted TIM-barrel fold metal-dependent hydrolase
VQFLIDVENFPDLDRVLGDFPVEVVIDHMGRPDTRHGTGAPGFQALIRLLQGGRGWSKLSAPYRTSVQPFPHADITPFAHALVAAAPDRLVWGSDWPHVMLDTAMPNDGDLCDQLATWAPDAATRTKILVSNPARLYGFK